MKRNIELMLFSNVPSEYVCLSCKQMRLSYRVDKTKCGNCGSKDIVVGPVGTLDKAKILSNAQSEG